MIVCNRCGKENQDHYKFCLGCGAELTAPPKQGDVAMMKTMMADPAAGLPGPTGPGASMPRAGAMGGPGPGNLGGPAPMSGPMGGPKPIPRSTGPSPGMPPGMSGMPPAGPLAPAAPMGPPPGVPGFSPGFAPAAAAPSALRRCPSCGSDVAPSAIANNPSEFAGAFAIA